MPGGISPPGRVRHPVPGKAAKRTMVVGRKGKKNLGEQHRREAVPLRARPPGAGFRAGGGWSRGGMFAPGLWFYSPSKSWSSDSASASSSNGSRASSSLSVVAAALTTSCSTSERL